MDAQESLSLDDFAALEQKVFSVKGPGIDIQARLIETKKLSMGLREGGSFAVLLQGPAAPELIQATYQVSHDAIGTQDIFLVPVNRNDEGFCYEAVFT